MRRFAQASWDHRGTPEAPGRVLTLIPTVDWRALDPDEATLAERDDGDLVWGVMWSIDPAHGRDVRAYLDEREKAGYTCERVTVYERAADGSEAVVRDDCSIYVGHVDGPDFAGPMALDALARHIHASVGPSGRNKDYVYELAAIVKTLSPHSGDAYLDDLERRLRELDAVQSDDA